MKDEAVEYAAFRRSLAGQAGRRVDAAVDFARTRFAETGSPVSKRVKPILTCRDGRAVRGVYEIVVDCGPGYRVYACKSGRSLFLLNGGIKKTQKRDVTAAKLIVGREFAGRE